MLFHDLLTFQTAPFGGDFVENKRGMFSEGIPVRPMLLNNC